MAYDLYSLYYIKYACNEKFYVHVHDREIVYVVKMPRRWVTTCKLYVYGVRTLIIIFTYRAVLQTGLIIQIIIVKKHIIWPTLFVGRGKNEKTN